MQLDKFKYKHSVRQSKYLIRKKKKNWTIIITLYNDIIDDNYSNRDL